MAKFAASRNSEIHRPKSYKEAINDLTQPDPTYGQRWREAIETEVDNLADQNTLEYEELPAGRGNRIEVVVQSKYTSGGSIERFKTRLVARGFPRVPGVDLTFAPTVRREVISILALIAHQVDIVGAYLERLSDSNELPIYIKPPGINRIRRRIVWSITEELELVKAIGERLWNMNAIKFFNAALGFEHVNRDASILIHLLIIKNNWSRSSLLSLKNTTPGILERQ